MNFPALVCGVVLMGSGAASLAQTPPSHPQAEVDGQARAAELWAQAPAQDLTNRAVLRVRMSRGPWRDQPVLIRIFTTPEGWTSIYETVATTNQPHRQLILKRGSAGEQEYHLVTTPAGPGAVVRETLTDAETMVPFADSDFWVADLGLEFLRWPTQRLLRSELRRSRSCDVLESVTAAPAADGYARVRSWIDKNTGGIVYAEAFDTHGKLLKEFLPKTVKKIQDRWELKEMEIINRQTGSRSRLVFDLESQ